jgi:hypothetical protein
MNERTNTMKKTYTLNKDGVDLGTFKSLTAAMKASNLNAAWSKPWSPERIDKVGDIYTAEVIEATYTITIA